MALIFLLFMCVDLAFPPPCAEASERVSVSSVLVVGVVTDVPNLALANDFHSSALPEETCRDEDCCFWCAHLLPLVTLTEISVFDAQTASCIVLDREVLSPPLQGPYHPPRSV
jgi:hypothetical protein